jgi:ubiquinone/menaquinone biosynthesis C-methylase UbiE
MFRAEDRSKCDRLFERYYSGRRFGDAFFRDRIRKYLLPGQHLLDAGCGPYLKFAREFAALSFVVGVDLVSGFETDNQQVPFGVRADLGCLPFHSNSFDMVISRSVVEHLEDPERVFREFYRVLRPGGKLVIITPNKYDYVSLLAAITPYWLHRKLVSKLFPVSQDDVFPTRYRANTRSSIKKALVSAGFAEKELRTINHYPAYLMFSPVLFRLGILYERLTSLEVLRTLRSSILCVFEKKALTRSSDARRAAAESEAIHSKVTVS